jgi:hypothetical protein
MKSILNEIATDVFIFIAAMVVTTGACTKKAVTCGAQDATAEVRSP